MPETTVVQSKKTTLAAWKKNQLHDITLPSGTEVKIKVPNLPALIKAGQIPNDLIDAAIGSIQADKVDRSFIEQQAEFARHIVPLTVVEPVITVDDVDSLPFEDTELIVEIATRQRDVDAIGHHIGGLHHSKEWRAFRGIADID